MAACYEESKGGKSLRAFLTSGSLQNELITPIDDLSQARKEELLSLIAFM